MDFESRYLELLSKPKDEDLISELTQLQEESIKENDADIYLKSSHLLFDAYVNLGDYDSATSLFLNILKENRFESYKTIVEIIDKLVQLLLKTEDFKQLEALLKMRERYLSGNPSQQLMQKFYLSVCQEGLKNYSEAIITLESIIDNISNNNLVSKYLKLALLYLRVNNQKKAKEAYEHAKIFDKTMKNEMFYLVASDLAFVEREYEEALKHFQAFFIKTKVKTRYLDRFIYINIELNRLGEAWRFYQEYLPKIMKSASKNYRMQYYQAGLVLANKVNDIDETAKLHERIRSLELVSEDILDSFDGIKVLLTFSSSKIKFNSKRDIILETYRVLASLSDFNRLLYLFPSLDGLTLYTYKKGLLMEKIVSHHDYKGTILDTIIEQDLPFHLFTKEEIVKETDYLTRAVFQDNDFSNILAYRIGELSKVDGYVIAMIDKNRQFDYINKLLYTTKSILEEKLAMHRLLDHHESLHRLSEKLLSSKKFGLYKIEDNLVFLQNDESKKQLEVADDFITFENFQQRIQGKMIYLDDLLGKDQIELTIKKATGLAQYRINIWQVDLAIHLLFEDITPLIQTETDLSQKAFVSATYQLNTMHALKRSIESLNNNSVLMGFWIQGEGLNQLRRNDYHYLYDSMQKLITDSAKSHVISLALDEDNGLLLHLLSLDKRVHQRIASEVTNGMNNILKQNLYLDYCFSIKVGATTIQKNNEFTDILKNLDQTRFIKNDEILTYYDKSIITKTIKIQTLYDQYQNFVLQKRIPVIYQEIGNLLTKKIEGYYVAIDEFVIHGEIKDFHEMIRELHLEKDCFILKINTIIQAINELEKATSHTVQLMIDLPAQVLIDSSLLEESIKKLKRYKVPLERLIFRINRVDIAYEQFDIITYMKAKGIQFAYNIGIYQALELMSNHPSIVDYLLIDSKEYSDSTKVWFDSLLKYLKQKTIIVDNNLLLKEETLVNSKLYLVMGHLRQDITLDELKIMVK